MSKVNDCGYQFNPSWQCGWLTSSSHQSPYWNTPQTICHKNVDKIRAPVALKNWFWQTLFASLHALTVFPYSPGPHSGAGMFMLQQNVPAGWAAGGHCPQWQQLGPVCWYWAAGGGGRKRSKLIFKSKVWSVSVCVACINITRFIYRVGAAGGRFWFSL